MKKWTKRIIRFLIAFTILAFLVGIIYEQIGRSKVKEHAKSRTGKLVELDDHKLYYEKKGDKAISVIFEAGAVGDHRAWHKIPDTISNYATAISYDRAGLCWSDRGNKNINAESISTDLENLLQTIEAPKPYILVGHSAASLYLRPFIKKYHDDIKGIILLDPSHPEQELRAPDEIKDLMSPPFFPPKWLVNFLNTIGIPRFLMGDPLFCLSIQKGGAYDEMEYLMVDLNENPMSPPEEKWAIPLLVVSAGNMNAFPQGTEAQKRIMMEFWSELQKETTALSNKGQRIVAEKSGHQMLYSERKLIITEIIKMINLQQDTLSDLSHEEDI